MSSIHNTYSVSNCTILNYKYLNRFSVFLEINYPIEFKTTLWMQLACWQRQGMANLCKRSIYVLTEAQFANQTQV